MQPLANACVGPARTIAAVSLALLCSAFVVSTAAQDPGAEAFAREVDMRLELPVQEQADYAKRLESTLAIAAIADSRPQYFVLVDRSPRIQAAFVYWRSADAVWHFIGASPSSTGRPGRYDYFVTPLGLFAHSVTSMDFRAEGTRNALGVLGYGRKGMRVYDFCWVMAERGWGRRGLSLMRLQLHATDPGLLEPLLGSRRSKGCIRIAASLNDFIDRHGLLDAEYEAAVRAGQHLWVLRADREPTPSPGRWMAIVDSGRTVRPAWSPTRPQRRSGPAPIKIGAVC